jgi:hypothetical protein
VSNIVIDRYGTKMRGEKEMVAVQGLEPRTQGL